MFEFVAYTIAWAGLCFGVAGGLYLIFAHMDARDDFADRLTDGDCGSVPRGFHSEHSKEYGRERL